MEAGVTALNTAIQNNAETGKYIVADVKKAFDEHTGGQDLYNADVASMDIDFHPNAAGHEILADTFAAAIPSAPAPAPISISVKASSDYHGSVFGGGGFMKGDQVTLVAYPKHENIRFAYWLDNSVVLPAEPTEAQVKEAIVSYDSTYTFTAQKDISLTAVFAYKPYVYLTRMGYETRVYYTVEEMERGIRLDEEDIRIEIGSVPVTIEKTAFADTVTVGGAIYNLDFLVLETYNEAEDAMDYELLQSFSVPVAPVYNSVEYWQWLEQYEQYLTVAYLRHNHAYETKYDANGHWTECACKDKTEAQPHSFANEADTTCDCGYSRTVELAVTVTGKDTTITYTTDDFDLAGMFTVDPNAGAATYTVISGGTGVGTVDGTKLSITKSGTFVIKVTTAKNGVYLPGEATATLTVEKATPEFTVPGPYEIHAGDPLRDIMLPPGFAWEDPGQTMPASTWEITPTAIYTPEDTDNYKTVPVSISIHNLVHWAPVTDVGPIGHSDVEKSVNVIESGKIVNATVKVDFRNENEVPVDDAEKIRDYANANFSGKTYGIEWLDISVIGEDGRLIPELDRPLAFGFDMTGRKVLGVVSVHDGELMTFNRFPDASDLYLQETMNHTKNNILVKAAQAMLQQANTVPQGVLSLLNSTYAIIYEVEQIPDTPSLPQTGDNSHMALWLALLFISGGALIALTVYDRKRRNTSNN